MRARAGVALAAAFTTLIASAATRVQAAERTPAEIPFALAGGYIVVQAELAPGRTLPFIFDSGLSDANLISADAAKSLGLAAAGKVDVQDASGHTDSADLAMVHTLRLGRVTLVDQTFAIGRIPRGSTPGGAPIAGLLGAPLMRNAVICIDYRRGLIQRWSRADFDDAGLAAIPMRLNHGLPTIALSIDGRQATVVADSGNNSGVEVYPAFAEPNEVRERYPGLKVRHGVGGGGRIFEVLVGVADAVEINPQTVLRQVPLLVVPQAMDPAWGIDGMAGVGLLSRLNPCLDRDGHRLLWSADGVVRD